MELSTEQKTEILLPKWHTELSIFNKVKPQIIIEGNILDKFIASIMLISRDISMPTTRILATATLFSLITLKASTMKYVLMRR